MTDRDRLLRIIYEVGQDHPQGHADTEECRRRLGTDKATMQRLANQLQQLGYFDRHRPLSTYRLSGTGILAAERL
jgi:DNA-binding IclR family transcriptional regulator